MALSKIIKIGNGVTNQFAVSFELGYINESDITVQVNNEVDGLGDPIYRNITFLTPELLQIDGAIPANGVNVEFVRTVPSDFLLVDYEDGDIINDENMNTSQKQALMLIHQLLDGRFEKFDSGFDMGGFVITGLGVPTVATDAVRLRTASLPLSYNLNTKQIDSLPISRGGRQIKSHVIPSFT